MLHHNGWTPVNPRDEHYDTMKSIAARQKQCLAEDDDEEDSGDAGAVPDLADPVVNERDPLIQTDPRHELDNRKARRVTLSDKAGTGLNDPFDDTVQLIDRLVDSTNNRKGYARMKGKDEHDLPTSLRRMSQIEHQQAPLNDSMVTALIPFKPAVRKQFKLHFDTQVSCYKCFSLKI